MSSNRWRDPWHVDMRYGKIGEEMDAEGWTYGKCSFPFNTFIFLRILQGHVLAWRDVGYFQSVYYCIFPTKGVDWPGFALSRKKRTYRTGDGVRRRRWVRTRVPKPPDINDPNRPIFLVWEVNLQPDGRTHLGVSSTVRIKNLTPLPLDVQALVDEVRKGGDGRVVLHFQKRELVDCNDLVFSVL
jgi:hypothetical protein